MHKLVSSSSRFHKSGLAGPLLAVAVGTTAVMTANAQITYSGLEDISVVMTNTTPITEPINLTGSGGAEFTLEGTIGSGITGEMVTFASGFEYEGSGIGGKNSDVTLLTLGASVGSSAGFATSPGRVAYNALGLADGGDAYVGFEFNPSGSLELYGWTQFSRSADGNTLTLVDWAYDTSGAAIPAGSETAAPEPSTVALGMTGVLLGGIRWYQRRRA